MAQGFDVFCWTAVWTAPLSLIMTGRPLPTQLPPPVTVMVVEMLAAAVEGATVKLAVAATYTGDAPGVGVAPVVGIATGVGAGAPRALATLIWPNDWPEVSGSVAPTIWS